MDSRNTLPLQLCRVQTLSLTINRAYTLLHLMALAFLLRYRVLFLLQRTAAGCKAGLLLHLSIFASELVLAFIWLLRQAYLYRPVSRNVYPERLPGDESLPGIDVFVCTADPTKEPPVEVMNTVLSAMALDYPPNKLHVYLSDDGGCQATLMALREARRFSQRWLPFCRKYGIKTRCPQAYFSGGDEGDQHFITTLFLDEKAKVKKEYEEFRQRVTGIAEVESCTVNRDHPPVVEVIDDETVQAEGVEKTQIPLLVYVSREKRPSRPHHFKIRVSGLMSNSPYILGLDCDAYCNDSNSAREAMCFHLDPVLSSSLAFVQFPQRFHNISKNDIYGSQLRDIFSSLWSGIDGLKGPVLSGTGYYMKREALYGMEQQGVNLTEFRKRFGQSHDFIKMLVYSKVVSSEDFSDALLQETRLLASCAYEDQTEWGKEVGFMYFSVVEDYFTGFILHCQGWTSVFYNPTKPAFLGAGTTILNDCLIQSTRWCAGLMEVGLSRFSPVVYGSSRMSILQSMCYGWFSLFPLSFLSLWVLATIPPLCLLNGISLYPQLDDPNFIAFTSAFLLSISKHIQEILSTGGSIQSWSNEVRIWMIKSATSYLYGSSQAALEKVGMTEANFLPTNKVIDDEKSQLYRAGKFDFQTSSIFLIPLCSLVILNWAGFAGGLGKVAFTRHCSDMAIQLCLTLYAVIISYPIAEGMLFRKDKGRIPFSITLISVACSTAFIVVGSLALVSLRECNVKFKEQDRLRFYLVFILI